MVSIEDNRMMILEDNGDWVQFHKQIGLMHQDCLDEYSKSRNLSLKTASDVAKKTNSIVIYNLNDEALVGYMPGNITEEQLYQLDLLTLGMDKVNYMEIEKEDEEKTHFTLDGNVSELFSNQVIQSYYNTKGKSK